MPGQGEVPLRRLGAGEVFGEIALISDQPRSAMVRTVTGVDVLAMDREAFHALFFTSRRSAGSSSRCSRRGPGSPEVGRRAPPDPW